MFESDWWEQEVLENYHEMDLPQVSNCFTFLMRVGDTMKLHLDPTHFVCLM